MTPPTPGAMRAAEKIGQCDVLTSTLEQYARIIDAETGKDREELVAENKALRDALDLAVKSCSCKGTGRWNCHLDEPPIPCVNKWCINARLTLAGKEAG